MISSQMLNLVCLAAICVGPNAQEPKPIVSGLQLYRTHRESDVPVDVEMIVNYHDTADHQFFVQDGTVAIYVDDLRQPGSPAFDSGDRVRIRGYLDADRSCLVSSDIQLVGHSDPIVPRTVDFGTLQAGHWWSSRVRAVGTLRHLCIGPKSCFLTCQAPERYFLVKLPASARVEELKKAIGAAVSIVGTMEWVHDIYGRTSVPMCMMMQTDPIQISSVKSGPRSAERTTVRSILIDGRNAHDRVQVTGVVACMLSRKAVLVEDGLDGVVVEFDDIYGVDPGRIVRVEGPVMYRDGATWPAVQAKIVYLDAIGVPPIAKRVSAAQIVEDNGRPQFVEIEADVEDLRSKGKVRQLSLKDDGANFAATLLVGDEEYKQMGLGRASRIRFQGAVTPSDEPSHDFNVMNFGVARIEVLETWFQLDRSRVAIVAGTAAAVVGLGAMLIFFLGRQVRRKNRELTGLTAQLNSAFEAVEEGLLVLDLSGRIVSSNSRFEELFGFRPQSAGDLRTGLAGHFSSPSEFNTFWQGLEGMNRVAGCDFETRTGRAIEAYSAPVFDHDEPTGRLWAFSDITERRNLESKLLQSQRLEAVGRLAGGIAHDFNNLLMGISGNLELIQRDEQHSGRYLTAAGTATARAAKLVQHLLGFSRQTALEIQVLDPNETIRNLYRLAEPTFPANIRFSIDLQATTAVEGDQVQLEQVLLNLCLNARDAINKNQGSIRIRTTDTTDDKLGDCVLIEVTDTGDGMSEDVRTRIFEPFFSTKEPGKGTGLGLAMSFGIIEQHGGRIECESKPDAGTTFFVYLPRTSASPTVFPVESLTPLPPPRIAEASKGHILLADDEVIVRETGESILELAGFDVTVATNGAEVIDRLNDDETIDVLVLDLTMPILSGRNAVRMVSTSHPDLPVIVCSGHLMDSDFGELGTLPNVVDMIQKPFRAKVLLKTVDLAFERQKALQAAKRALSPLKDASGRVQSG